MQRHWINRSEGANIQFEIEGHGPITVFTTRPDTLFGVSYLALAYDHPWVQTKGIKDPGLQAFITQCQQASTAESDLATQEKLGHPTALTAIHPLSGERIPVWVTNYVLMDYGSGAVMGVPAHDQRDFEFATRYDLPIKSVIDADDDALPMLEMGPLKHSGVFNGLHTQEAQTAILSALTTQGCGQKTTTYRLRD